MFHAPVTVKLVLSGSETTQRNLLPYYCGRIQVGVSCMEDYYDDDPIEDFDNPVKTKKFKLISGLALLAVSALFLRSTFASNISINSTPVLEFGQGFTALSSCAGSPVNLTVTPSSTFMNVAGGGSHYFKSVRVDNVPAACQGVDFSFSTYDASSSSVNPMFDSTTIAASQATIYMSSSNKFYPVNSGDISVTTNSATSFTASLDAPSSPSNNVAKLTIQSSTHNSNIGSVWTSSPNVPASSAWASVTFGAGKFVAVGSNTAGNSGQAMYSSDGINWTLATGVPNHSWSSVVYGNGKFVAMGWMGWIMYSSDGITWTASSASFSGNTLYGLAYGNGKYITSYTSGYYYSSDGISWTQLNLGSTRNRITFGNGQFLALDGNAGLPRWSTDGLTWTTTSDTTPQNTYFANAVYGNGTLLGTTSAGVPKSAYSNDNGRTWTLLSIPSDNYYSGAFGNGLFALIGYDSLAHTPYGIYSRDGTSWTSYSSLPSGDWDGITFANGMFVAVANTGQAMYSK